MNILRTLARPLIAAPFILSGFDALARPAGHRERAALYQPLLDKADIHLSGRQLDLSTRLLGLTNIACGTCLALGKAPRISATVLSGVQVPLALANNPFWTHRGAERSADIAGLIVQGGLLGGLLLAASDLAGQPSYAWRRANNRDQRAEVRAVKAQAQATADARVNKIKASYDSRIAKVASHA